MLIYEFAHQKSLYKAIKWFDDDFFKLLFRKYLHFIFDNTNKKIYIKNKINEIQFKDPELFIKSIILLVNF